MVYIHESKLELEQMEKLSALPEGGLQLASSTGVTDVFYELHMTTQKFRKTQGNLNMQFLVLLPPQISEKSMN